MIIGGSNSRLVLPTGLAYVLVIGTPERFPCGKQIGSYTGLIPCEDSSAGRQRLGASCWWKQRKQPHAVTQTGDVGIYT